MDKVKKWAKENPMLAVVAAVMILVVVGILA